MRRILVLLVLLGVAGAAVLKLRGQATPATAPAAPSWPPIPDRSDPVPAALEPEPEPAPVATWKPINPDGTVPEGYPIKANSQSMIFHVPTGRFYERTKPERCYTTEAAAVADGYRRSKS